MENASKALIIAGSVLMALIVIGALIFMFQQMSSTQQTIEDVDELGKITEYSKKFEQYNKTIYGSELLSIANLQEDYNKLQAEAKGYEKIQIIVKIKNSIFGTTYFSEGTKDISTITSDKYNIEEEISGYERKTNYKGKTVKTYAQMSNREISTIYDIAFSSDESDYEVGDRLMEDSRTKKLMQNIENYKNIKSCYTEFKNKRFKCTKVEYDNNGRVKYMSFEEK